MKLLLLSIACLYLGTAHAVAGFILNPYRFANAGSSFLVQEGFEGTGYENTWTEAATGTVNEDQTATVITGSQSLQISISTQTGSAYVDFTSQSTIYIKFRLRVASTGGNHVIATIRNGTTVLGTLTLAGANRVFRVTAFGAGNATSTDVLPVDTDLYCWFEYVQGTGSNAICRAGWATTDTKPNLATTAGKVGNSSTGTLTDQPSRLYLGNTVGTGVFNIFFDTVQISASAF